ncbi:2'-5' RNA ligase family protein [Clostridium sp. 19966]|uniref:2'-5' RNA ligase family protein n=1 Tax=Clostridium sp. 19966 TaxID=2768166 RepID=UPI0028E089EF|nr:2'-5' RNA ligase family protein [Clostridium sp. 19966]MDT8717412.1 2'-5' RNA ligase family protein [Clostridium sp. 19966]
MNRYVIVCLLEDKILEFHNKLLAELCQKYDVKRQKLGAHFTIKAPFERERIDDIVEITEEYAKLNKKAPIMLKGIGNFRDSVLYIPIYPSEEAMNLNNNYFNRLKRIPDLEFKRNELLNKVYHCTILSKLREPLFSEVKIYLDEFSPCFETYFSNISILKWNNHSWEIYKKFDFS